MKVKEQMTAEDEILNYIKNLERIAASKVEKEKDAIIAQKNRELEEKDRELEAMRLKFQQAGL